MTIPESNPALRLRRDGGLAHLTLARPQKGNAIDRDLGVELTTTVEAITEGDEVRAILLDAEGPNFGLGGDIDHMRSIEPHRYGQEFGEMIDAASPGLIALRDLGVPIVAAVRGWAVGASLALVSLADIVVASENARFRTGFVGLALPGDLGITWSLPRAIGSRRARALLLENTPFDAATAERWGLVTRVVTDDALDEEAKATAERLATGPTIAHRHILRNVTAAASTDLADHVLLERAATVDCGERADLAEALEAFADRRTPTFRGR